VTNASRIAYLDCSSGVSGDKLLGALLDAGSASGEFTAEHLRQTVTAIAPEARVDVDRVSSHGLSALSVRVSAEGESPRRHWRDIRTLLETAALPEDVRAAARRTFEALAAAEASAHGVAIDEVHFHEVGAIDSIADIVGVCAGMRALGIQRLVASSVAVGSGTVQSAHGVLPIPAPATATLLAGVPILGGPVAGELTTPTGAALLKGLGAKFGALPPMRAEHTGYGAGTRDIGMPNVCQLMVGLSVAGDSETPELPIEPVVLLESNIDHVSAEELAFAAEELLGGGALDVWQTPIVMKKGRAAVTLSVLVVPEMADALAARMVALTGTLGVRHQHLGRTRAPRDMRQITTPWGPVRLKTGGGRIRPEHDDVARIAREHSLAYSAVAREIVRLAEEPDAIDNR
jgi:pyridinium-3,5-bisthiocarboxylic acid mononucleotide nickel chelatase